MRRIPLITGQFNHVFNRGVERRDIFLEAGDYARFVHDLYEFNDRKFTFNLHRKLHVRSPAPNISRKRDMLVDIIAWCLMPNHFHLLLRQLVENGIAMFMHKLGTGHANSFNLKYERSGVLFQGRFKAVPIGFDTQLKHVIRYIHLNPVDLIEPGWKEHGIKDWKKVNKFLEEEYRWSSYRDYIGKKNFPSVLNNELIKDLHGNDLRDHKRFVQEWLAKDIDNIRDIVIE